jgi:sporulation protein YlmC with PRC-barrel domain
MLGSQRHHAGRHLRHIAAVPLLALCLAGPSFAADAPGDALRGNAIVGKTVSDDRGERLGKVDDLIIARNGTISRVVLALDGGVVSKGKLVAVPFRDLKVSASGLTYAGNREKLQAQPEFKYGSQVADATGSERERYSDQAKQRMSEWETRLDQAKKGASEGATEAGRKLDQAWSEVKSKWSDVENASNDGWNRAKSDFERAWRNLERTFKDATR